MTPLAQFIGTFLVVSAVSAAVTAAVEVRDPGKAARAAVRFFVYVVVGIAAFSVLVYFLEQVLIRKG